MIFVDAGSYFIARASLRTESHAIVRLVKDVKFVNFQLSGEQVSVVLSSSEFATSEDSYHVVFDGSARRVMLKRNGRELTSVSNVSPLSTSRLHDVWLMWYDAEVVLGESKSVGEQVILQYRNEKQYNVKSIAVSGLNKSNVEWKCSTQLGEI